MEIKFKFILAFFLVYVHLYFLVTLAVSLVQLEMLPESVTTFVKNISCTVSQISIT